MVSESHLKLPRHRQVLALVEGKFSSHSRSARFHKGMRRIGLRDQKQAGQCRGNTHCVDGMGGRNAAQNP